MELAPNIVDFTRRFNHVSSCIKGVEEDAFDAKLYLSLAVDGWVGITFALIELFYFI